MTITTAYPAAGTYVIMNRGRIIRKYTDAHQFVADLEILRRLAEQLKRPEAFCDCQDINTKGKR